MVWRPHFGYLPEVLSYTIAGKLLDTYPGYQGYHLNFLYMIAMGRDWINRCDYLDKKSMERKKADANRSIIKKKEG